MNDGLVSNILLILGVAGGTSDRSIILLAGLAGLLAGAFSMAAGEWVSVQSQRELYEREIAVEREELAAFPEEELEELILIYQAKGLSEDEAKALAGRIMRRPESALDTLTREELGLAPGDLGSPWVAALSSFGSFAVGALIPVVPFLFGSGPAALIVAIGLSAVSLFAGRVGHRRPHRPQLPPGRPPDGGHRHRRRPGQPPDRPPDRRRRLRLAGAPCTRHYSPRRLGG